MLQFGLVFIAVAIVDIFWTQYLLAATKYKVLQAGFFSAMIVLVGAFSTLAYVHDGWMIIPAALGAFAGSAITTYYNRKKAGNASE